MSTTYTSNLKLGKPAANDTSWGTGVLNPNADALEALAALAGGCVTAFEVPSASLNVRVAAFDYLKPDGTIGSYAGSSSYALTASNTNYLYLDSSYALAKSTSSFPATAAHIRLATAVAGGSTVTSIADSRLYQSVMLPRTGMTLTDAVNIAVGTSTGTKIGTATSQKLGFYNATPIVQRVGADQAAVVTTAATQTTPYGFATQAQADAIVALANELRAALVALGLIKGSA